MPTYTPNTPQSNQTISDTQPLILANFTYLQGSIGQEHNFDVTDPTKTYHKLASMPNNGGAPAVPAGTNGVYYVDGGLPRFNNGTDYAISLTTGSTAPQTIVSGTAALGGTAANIFTAINNTVGNFYVFLPGATNALAMGLFIATNGLLTVKYPNGTPSPGLNVGPTGLIYGGTAALAGTYKYVLVYYTP